jgi:putative transcriptional regulator
MNRRLLLPPVVAAAALVVATGIAAWPYTVDDAYVVARYGVRIAEGRGYTMNEGAPTDGVTGPLWLAAPIAARFVGIADPIGVSKGIGLLCMALSVALLGARLREPWYGRMTAWYFAAQVAVQSTLGVWAVAGLETGAAALAFTVSFLAAVASARPRAITAGLGTASLFWLRPEMAFASLVVLFGLAARHRRSGWIAASIASTGALGVAGFRYAMFGSVLPLAVYAKPGSLAHGLEYAGLAVLVTTGVIGGWLAWMGARAGGIPERCAGWAVIAHLVAVILAGGDWMPGFRLIAPILPLYVMLAACGVARVGSRGSSVRRAIGVLMLAGMVPGLNGWVQIPRIRDAGRTREVVGGELARWLSKRANTVALVDIGYLAYASGVEVVDLGGITDPIVGHSPGGHLGKRIDVGDVAIRSPDAVLIHSDRPPLTNTEGTLVEPVGFDVERRLVASSWMQDEFRVARVVRYSPRYYYVVFLRRDVADRLDSRMPVKTVPLRRGAIRWQSSHLMGVELSPGFLVASPSLLDPNFHRTVILLVDHGPEGSLGFVVNRPASVVLSNMVVRLGFEEGEGSPPDSPVLVGGPVAPDTGWIIFDDTGFEGDPEGSVQVTEHLAVSASRALLEAVIKGEGPAKLMLALGYAGWGASQLDSEIAQGAWIPADLDESIVFDTPFEQRWTLTLKSVGIDPARFAIMASSEA